MTAGKITGKITLSAEDIKILRDHLSKMTPRDWLGRMPPMSFTSKHHPFQPRTRNRFFEKPPVVKAPSEITAFFLGALSAYYGEVLPTVIEISESPVMFGYDVVLSIPGQTRQVFISKKDSLLMTMDEEVRERVLDQVKEAIFILLELETEVDD